MNSEKFSDRLRAARMKRGLKQKDAAQALSIQAGYLSELEKGKKTNPSDSLIERICREFSVSREWLLTGGGEKTPMEELNEAEEKAGTFDKEQQVLDEIMVRLNQFKYADQETRTIFKREIMTRVEEYDAWCEAKGGDVRNALLKVARENAERPTSTTNE